MFYVFVLPPSGHSTVIKSDIVNMQFVCVFAVLEPPVLLNNLTDCTVNVSSSVILSCPSEGIPAPEVTWYKNGHALLQGSGEKKKKY